MKKKKKRVAFPMILSSSQNEFINTNKHIKLFCDNNNNWINPTNYEIEFLFNKIKYNSCFCNYYNKSRNHVMYNLVNYWMNFMKCKKKKEKCGLQSSSSFEKIAPFQFIIISCRVSFFFSQKMMIIFFCDEKSDFELRLNFSCEINSIG